MAILINETTTCIIQGITGKEGNRAFNWMVDAGTRVVAGVTPGKGGQTVTTELADQTKNITVPVYNTVAEAMADFPDINCSSLYIPPKFAPAAVMEAMDAHIPLLHLIAEAVPLQDTARLLERAKAHQIRLLGPGSIGVIAPGKAKIGSIGGPHSEQFLAATPGQKGVTIISKSGGMTGEVANLLSIAHIPQTTALSIGGNRLIGTTFADLLPEIATDDETDTLVIVGEIGGAYEELFAEKISELKFQKRVIAFISGVFAETLPQGVSFGHAGAIVSKTVGTRLGKIKALQDAGVSIATTPEEIIALCQT